MDDILNSGNIPEDLFKPSIIEYIMQYFILGIILIPLISFLIYLAIHPETGATWGYKWRYKGDLEPTEGYLKYTRAAAIMSLLLILSLIIIFINQLYGTIFMAISIGAGLYYFLTKES